MIRRKIRKTIQRGSTVYATALSYNNGKANVLIGGKILSNLPAMGAIVPGQQAVLDYSAGVKPCVYPVGIPTTPVEPAPLQTVTGKRRTGEIEGGVLLATPLRTDKGVWCRIFVNADEFIYGQEMERGLEAAIYWRTSGVDYGTPSYSPIFDSGNMYSAYGSFNGTPYLTMPHTAKYLINLDINIGFPWGLYSDPAPWVLPGWQQVTLYGGGASLATEATWLNHSMNLRTIALLSAGDLVYAGLLNQFTTHPYVLSPSVSFMDFETNIVSIGIQLLAGTIVP